MRRGFPGISGDVTLQDLVEKFLLAGDSRYFIVRGPSGPAGIITLAAVRAVPRSAWPVTTVSQAMVPFHRLATTGPGASLWSALEEMGREGVNQLPVVEGNGRVA
jgi:CBS domain-containing protein